MIKANNSHQQHITNSILYDVLTHGLPVHDCIGVGNDIFFSVGETCIMIEEDGDVTLGYSKKGGVGRAYIDIMPRDIIKSLQKLEKEMQ